MLLLRIFVCLLMGAGLMSACGETQAPTALETPDPTAVQITSVSPPLTPDREWAWAFDREGRPWTAYYAEDDSIHLIGPDGAEHVLDRGDVAGKAAGLALTVTENGAFVLWRNKGKKGKQLFLSRFDGKRFEVPLELDLESDPLTRLQLAHTPEALYVLWLGEHDGYQLYFKYSRDGGKTFSQTFPVLQGIYPAWLVDERGVTVFSWSAVDGQLFMVRRRFDLSSGAFAEPQKIAPAHQISPIFQAFASQGREFLVWFGQTGTTGKDGSVEYVLEGVYSDDGEHWEHFRFEDTLPLDISKLDIAADGRGHIYLAYSARSFGDRASRDRLYMVRSEDNGLTWSQPIGLRHHPFDNTQATSPSVAAGDQGRVALVWVDWREIRPAIYANYSRDYGATWLPTDRRLSPPGGHVLSALQKTVSLRGDSLYVLGAHYQSDSLWLRNLDLYRVSFADLAGLPQAETPDGKDEDALRARADGLWQAFEAGRYEDVYAFYDPFFRARTPLPYFLTRMGTIKYHSHALGEVEFVGNIASIETDVVYSVPKLKVRNKEFERPKTKMHIKDSWVRVEGEWYREYRSEMDDRYTRY